MGKSAPSAPDPATTAAAQTQSNEQTAAYNQQLNMINSSGPNGTVNYSADPSAPGGYQQTTTLSPTQQGLYNSSTQAQQGALDVANQQIGRVGTALAGGLDPSSYGTTTNSVAQSPLATGYTSQAAQTGYNPGGAIQNGYTTQSALTGYNPGGSIQTGYGSGGQIQQQVQGAGTGSAAVQNASNAAYSQATSRLDPQFDQEQEALQSQLASQGLNSNDAAYQTAMTNFNNTKTDAYNQANYSAIAAGDTEQNTLYGQNLSSGQFANSAQLQGNTENASAASFANSAQAQQNSQNAAQAQFYNSGAAQNTAQNAALAQFGNSAQLQQNTENAAQAQFYNQGAAQNTSQNAAAAAFQNTAAGQSFSQGQSNAALNNSAQQQNFTQGAYAQELPINEFNSLLSSGQVQSPTGVSYTPASAQSTNVLQAYQNSYSDQLQSDQVGNSAINSGLGGLFSLGSAALSKYSDARLKEDIRRVGRLESGLPIYAYRFKGSPEIEIGVLAHEAARSHPHAVHRDPAGLMKVDYGALS